MLLCRGLQEQMASAFMPVDLDAKGLRVQHLDPPVFTVEGFFEPADCQEVIDAALESGGPGRGGAGRGGAGRGGAGRPEEGGEGWSGAGFRGAGQLGSRAV